MERKIGEIFEHNDEWYQCIENISCENCAFKAIECDEIDGIVGPCSIGLRRDGKSVVFKRLEKVGEPFACRNMSLGRYGIIVQRYKVFAEPILTDNSIRWCDSVNQTILIALNNKEDMEEKKLKPFDLEAAKAGKPVCTRDRRKARIICFDRNDLYPIVALIECEDGKEIIGAYSKEGQTEIYEIKGTNLMMLPEKKEGWIVIHKEAIYDKETAEKIARETTADVIRIQKIEWEE